MAIFTVSVIETSYGFAQLEANSLEEAQAKAEEEYHKGNMHWTASEFATQKVTE